MLSRQPWVGVSGIVLDEVERRGAEAERGETESEEDG
jgi:hypothetical protein